MVTKISHQSVSQQYDFGKYLADLRQMASLPNSPKNVSHKIFINSFGKYLKIVKHIFGAFNTFPSISLSSAHIEVLVVICLRTGTT